MNSSFEERRNQSKNIEELFYKLFTDDYELIPFGIESILQTNIELTKFLKRIDKINGSPEAMKLQFLPDYILFKKSSPQRINFIEFKLSATPCWVEKKVENIQKNDKSFNYSNIGEIARDALLSYKRFYPETIIIMAANYNKKLIMCSYAQNIKSIYTYIQNDNFNVKYNIDECPINSGVGYFDIFRNNNAKGSGTPNANINLDEFIELEQFFNEIGIVINKDVLLEIKDEIKKMELKLGKVNNDKNKKNKILQVLVENGCHHFKNAITPIDEYYTINGNNFYHRESCYYISGKMSKTEKYKPDQTNTKKPCIFCIK